LIKRVKFLKLSTELFLMNLIDSNQVCIKKMGNKENCFMDGPNGNKRYKEQEEVCNILPCPSMIPFGFSRGEGARVVRKKINVFFLQNEPLPFNCV